MLRFDIPQGAFCGFLEVTRNRISIKDIRQQATEASLAHRFAQAVKAGARTEETGLLGPEVMVVGGDFYGDRTQLPICMMASLVYLKPSLNESNRCVVAVRVSSLLQKNQKALLLIFHR